VAAAFGEAVVVLAGADVIGCIASWLGAAIALAEDPAGEPLIEAANAVRLARAVVSLDFVSSSRVTAAVALDADVPDVPVGFGSAGVAAVAAPVEGASARSSAKILSALAASAAHVAEPALAFTPALALDSRAVMFSMELMCFFSSAICDFAFPVTELSEMLFKAALASCRCCCGDPCADCSGVAVFSCAAGAAGVAGVCA